MSLLLAVLSVLSLGWQRDSARTHTVEIRGMAFHPAELTIARGDTVVWINRDIVPHTATSASTPEGKWDTGQLTQGASGRLVPGGVGTIRYVCTLHPTMLGKLVIR